MARIADWLMYVGLAAIAGGIGAYDLRAGVIVAGIVLFVIGFIAATGANNAGQRNQ